MRLAVIRGHATSTVKHPSFAGQRLLIAQPIDQRGDNDGAPQLVLDPLGAAIHQRVLLCSDGSWARDHVRNERSPARWWVAGIVDSRPGDAA